MLFVTLQRYEVTGTADIDAVVPFRDQYSVAILACQGSGVSVKVRHLLGSLVRWISSANQWQDNTRGACSTCECGYVAIADTPWHPRPVGRQPPTFRRAG